jgi:flagella basal body P-ring formation protein FlgA
MKKLLLALLLVLLLPALTAAAEGPMALIEAAITEYVLSHGGQRAPDAKVSISEVRLRGGVFPRGKVESLEVAPRNGARLSGLVSFNVNVRRRAKRDVNLLVTARVRVVRTVVRAARTIRMHEVIGADDVELADLDARGVPGAAARTLDEVVGMEATRPITAGRVVRTDYLKRPLMVRKGQNLVVMARVGQILVRARATALGDARLDSVVKARTPGGRIISGLVTGPGHIAVEMR